MTDAEASELEVLSLLRRMSRAHLKQVRVVFQFAATTDDSLMERSHIPLHKWLYAMYLLVTARKGISPSTRIVGGRPVCRKCAKCRCYINMKYARAVNKGLRGAGTIKPCPVHPERTE